MSKELILAYTAGLLDGEGHFGLGRAVRASSFIFMPHVAVGMTHKPTIEWLHKEFGGGFSNVKPSNERCEFSYRWQLGSQPKLLLFLPDVAYFLKTKKVQALLLLDFLQNFPACGSSYQNVGRRGELMNKYYEVLKGMNSVGPGSNEMKDKLSIALAP